MRSVLMFMILSNLVIFAAEGRLQTAVSAALEGRVIDAAGEVGYSVRRALYEQDMRPQRRRAFDAERHESRMAG